jgi:hypothetical protein
MYIHHLKPFVSFLVFLDPVKGFSELEIKDLEKSAGLKFPNYYKEYLFLMGKCNGNLDVDFEIPTKEYFLHLQEIGKRIVKKMHPNLDIKNILIIGEHLADAVVFINLAEEIEPKGAKVYTTIDGDWENEDSSTVDNFVFHLSMLFTFYLSNSIREGRLIIKKNNPPRLSPR